MMLRQKSEPRMSGGDVTFDTWNEEDRRVHVTVSEEAIEDYCDRRGITGSISQRFVATLEDIMTAASKVYDRDRSRPKAIVVTTQDLNG
jgi:hypothetical protein